MVSGVGGATHQYHRPTKQAAIGIFAAWRSKNISARSNVNNGCLKSKVAFFPLSCLYVVTPILSSAELDVRFDVDLFPSGMMGMG